LHKYYTNNNKLQTHNNNNNNNNNKLQFIINVRIYLSYFLYFQGLNFVFSSFKDAFVNGIERQKVKQNIMTNMPLC